MLDANLMIKLQQPFLKNGSKHPGLGIIVIYHRQVVDIDVLEAARFLVLANHKRLDFV
jgi:hypothetical protein